MFTVLCTSQFVLDKKQDTISLVVLSASVLFIDHRRKPGGKQS